ncbi:hypothetical protein LXL04_035166 [Taraxacum kok-saghyz]
MTFHPQTFPPSDYKLFSEIRQINQQQIRRRCEFKTLSVGGRLTLLKSVLGSVPIYNMSVFKVPMGVLKLLEKMRSRFFRGVDEAGKKMTWTSWDTVCASKEKGGLGVGSFYALNRSLLYKWVWRFKSQPAAFWVAVVKAIHGPAVASGPSRSSLWRDILRSGVDLAVKGVDLQSFCKKVIGNGANTRFWNEVWIGDSMLCYTFPRLFALEEDKEVSVADKLIGSWAASFRRPIRGGAEEAQGQALSGLLGTVQLNQLPDKWVWDLSSDGCFSVGSARHYVDDALLGGSAMATRWISLVPIKVNVFAWKMMGDALPTRWNLSQRGMELNTLICPICGEAVEHMEHLFFTCSFARAVMEKVLRWWGLPAYSIDSLPAWKAWLEDVRYRKSLKHVLEGVFFVTWWAIWKFRNQTLFGCVLPPKGLIFDEIVANTYVWCSNRLDKSIMTGYHQFRLMWHKRGTYVALRGQEKDMTFLGPRLRADKSPLRRLIASP